MMDHPLDYSYIYNAESADLIRGKAARNSERDVNKSKVKDEAKAYSSSLSHSSYDSSTSDEYLTVRSKAVVTYSASEKLAVYSRLPPRTDINDTPPNWLRKTVGFRPELLFGSNYFGHRGNEFSGFAMAGSHLQHIGKIDVVSDAENIKKLLKMPYSVASVSMVIHRFGRTLVLEEFDVKKYTTQESQWTSFRDFCERVLQQRGNTSLKKKSPSLQRDRIMQSKFLYHSVCEDSQKKQRNLPPIIQTTDEGKTSPHHDLNPELCKMSNVDYVVPVPNVPAISIDRERVCEDNPSSPDRRWRYWSAKENVPESSPVLDEDSFGFERNIFWTFEDLRMILGTNMPIFGGGKYPAVSLRLRDSQKPINVLTGIDYWLDNLICNVPELVMCFHVDGIVQNYEFIKTEDIPKLKDSGFSPQVIKDIAQNILSFLKSNCTKEGHTYWLFKGSGDDVVKLYDLSTLCQNDSQDSKSSQQQNPYVISVAMLLYKTAINLMQSQDPIIAGCDHRATVRKLLLHCIELLQETKHQHITGHALCLLSDLCLSESKVGVAQDFSKTDDRTGSLPSPKTWKSCDTCSAYLETEKRNSRSEQRTEGHQEIASISSVSDLYHPEKFVPSTQIQKCVDSDLTPNMEKSCLEAIRHAITGLNLLVKDCKKRDQGRLIQHLARNAANAYFRLAEKENKDHKLGISLKKIQLALKCHETYNFLVSKFGVQPPSITRTTQPTENVVLLPKILSLCGEIQFSLVQEIRMKGSPNSSYHQDLQETPEDDEKLLKLLCVIHESGEKYGELTKINTDPNVGLEVCERCYEMALNVLDEGLAGNIKCTDVNPQAIENDNVKRTKRASDKASSSFTQSSQNRRNQEIRNMIIRRHGHVLNERGALMLDIAVNDLNKSAMEDVSTNTAVTAQEKAASCFKNAYDRFYQVHDYLNQALVLSNTGRLNRVSAQLYSQSNEPPFSIAQRENFESALSNYRKALEILDSKDVKRNGAISEACAIAKDNISWDLSTCYIAMAQILQDSGFGNQSSREELEKEVIGWLKNSQKYCKSIWKNSTKYSIVLYRQSEVHHRLASLYHNSYRICSDSQKAKYLRNLAEKNYSIAIEILTGLEHPNKLLRVQLERLAMKEYYINSVTGVIIKSNLLVEGLQSLCSCSENLTLLREALSEKSFDPSEVNDLLRILVTILQSYLMNLVKVSSQGGAGVNRKSKNATNICPRLVRDLYGRALKNLQPVLIRGDESDEKIPQNLSLIVDILDEVSNSIRK